MSSATSTERPPERHSFRAGHFFFVAALAAATVAVMLSTRTAPEHLVMLSLTIFAAGAAAIAAYRAVAPLGAPDRQGGRPLAQHTRAALEGEKSIVLRTIKELEFDRAMKKVSEEDFLDMAQRLRQRAVRLMQQLDDTRAIHRARIEEELERALDGTPGAPTGAANRAAADESPTQSTADRARCASCDAMNDADARFCKACGQRLGS